MRQRYESKQDLARERAAIDLLIEARGGGLLAVKLADSERADFLLIRDRVVCAAVEYKWREDPRLTYKTYYISKSKIVGCLLLAQEIGVPFLLCVQWFGGGPYYARISALGRVGMGGRTDRGDPADLEEVSHYDINIFKPVRRKA